MNMVSTMCRSCNERFEIAPEDLEFYGKLQVPPPTWCPECRLARRMQIRNERTLYRRKCSAPGHSEEIISMFSPEKKLNVYDPKAWWSDSWDPLDFGSDYDFSQNFFLQFRTLLERVPLIGLSVTNMANSEFCNVSEGDKDCYMLSASQDNENVLYSNKVTENKDSVDLYAVNGSELCYELVHCDKCYRLKWSRDCIQCTDSALLYDCVNCSNCFGCANLRNKSYCLFNQQFTKEEYQEQVAKYDPSSNHGLSRAKGDFSEFLADQIHRYALIFKSENVTGDNIVGSKNCSHCFDLVGSPAAENCKYVAWAGMGLKDSMDAGPGIGVTAELIYESVDSGYQGSRFRFTNVVYGGTDVQYSINCHGCSYLFGCYGLRQKQYCILNKQYSKEEYLALIPKIAAQMNEHPYTDKVGRTYGYGEFFPPELQLFAYNESVAQEYFPLSREEALARGFDWRDPDTKDHIPTIRQSDIPDSAIKAGDSILNETLECADLGACNHGCTKAYRITSRELEFYRRQGLPIPKLCFNCRHFRRLAQRNPLKLWNRQCQCAGTRSENGRYNNAENHSHGSSPCAKTFETAYAPDRPEIVYCEECYQAETA